MEKMRRIFPGLFVLVLALLVVLLPVREARAYDEPKDLVCPQCGGTLEVIPSYVEINFNAYRCTNCCYNGDWADGGSKLSEFTCSWKSEWSIDNEKGTHYHECSNKIYKIYQPCPLRNSEAPHTVSSWTPVEGTDTHTGTCDVCGATVTENHNFDIQKGNAEGDWMECVCGAKNGTPQDHQWGDDWYDSDEGTHYRRCTTCDEPSTPVAHEFVITDIGGGYHQNKCVCGAVNGDPEKCQFELVDVGEGYHMSRCVVCDAIQEGTEAELHQFGAWVPVAEKEMHRRTCACGAAETENCSGGTATCAAPAVCATCGQSYGEKDPDNHDLVNHDAQDPTCTEVGWNAYDTCSRCDYTTYVEKKAPGHDLVHHDAKAASCTEVGWDAYDTCSRCDYTTYVEKKALGHDLVHHDAKVATCTEVGWDAYDTCSRCDYTTYVEKKALSHDLVHHDAKAASCTEVGWDAYDTCSRCDYTTYVEKKALGHDLVHHDAKAATCTEVGWDAYDTCSRCDYTTYVEKKALDHDLVHHDAKAATCTEVGWDAYDTCSRCDYTTYVEKKALGHTEGERVLLKRVEPQVGKEGYEDTAIYCTTCGERLIFTYRALEALPEPEPEVLPEPLPEAVIAQAKKPEMVVIPDDSSTQPLIEKMRNAATTGDVQTGLPAKLAEDIPESFRTLKDAVSVQLKDFDFQDGNVLVKLATLNKYSPNESFYVAIMVPGEESLYFTASAYAVPDGTLRFKLADTILKQLKGKTFVVIVLGE